MHLTVGQTKHLMPPCGSIDDPLRPRANTNPKPSARPTNSPFSSPLSSPPPPDTNGQDNGLSGTDSGAAPIPSENATTVTLDAIQRFVTADPDCVLSILDKTAAGLMIENARLNATLVGGSFVKILSQLVRAVAEEWPTSVLSSKWDALARRNPELAHRLLSNPHQLDFPTQPTPPSLRHKAPPSPSATNPYSSSPLKEDIRNWAGRRDSDSEDGVDQLDASQEEGAVADLLRGDTSMTSEKSLTNGSEHSNFEDPPFGGTEDGQGSDDANAVLQDINPSPRRPFLRRTPHPEHSDQESPQSSFFGVGTPVSPRLMKKSARPAASNTPALESDDDDRPLSIPPRRLFVKPQLGVPIGNGPAAEATQSRDAGADHPKHSDNRPTTNNLTSPPIPKPIQQQQQQKQQPSVERSPSSIRNSAERPATHRQEQLPIVHEASGPKQQQPQQRKQPQREPSAKHTSSVQPLAGQRNTTHAKQRGKSRDADIDDDAEEDDAEADDNEPDPSVAGFSRTDEEHAAALKIREEALIPIQARYDAFMEEEKSVKDEPAAAAVPPKGRKRPPKKAPTTAKKPGTYDGWDDPNTPPELRIKVSAAYYDYQQRKAEGAILKDRTAMTAYTPTWGQAVREARKRHGVAARVPNTDSLLGFSADFGADKLKEVADQNIEGYHTLGDDLKAQIGGGVHGNCQLDRFARVHLGVNFGPAFVEAGNLPKPQRQAVRRRIKHEACWGTGKNGQKLGLFVVCQDLNPFADERGCDNSDACKMVNVSRIDIFLG